MLHIGSEVFKRRVIQKLIGMLCCVSITIASCLDLVNWITRKYCEGKGRRVGCMASVQNCAVTKTNVS